MKDVEGLMTREDVDTGPLPLTLNASRLRSALFLVVFLGFTALGVWMIIDTGEWLAWFCTLFFGLGAVIFAVNLLPNASYLRLEDDGFTYSSLFRQHTVKWAVVSEFGLMVMRSSNLVAWTFVPNHKTSRTMRQLNRAIGGFDAALPDTYGLKAVNLVVVMATLRDRYWQGHGLTEKDIAGEVVPVSDNASWAGK